MLALPYHLPLTSLRQHLELQKILSTTCTHTSQDNESTSYSSISFARFENSPVTGMKFATTALTCPQMGKKSAKARPNEKRSSSPAEDEEDTQHSINDAERSTPKRPKMQRELSYDNLITTPKKSGAFKPPLTAETPSPTPHAHGTRGTLRGRPRVNYDMRFHPADKVLRPNHAATKAAQQADQDSQENDSEVDDDVVVLPSEDEDRVAEGATEALKSTVKHEVPEAVHHRSTRSGRQVRAANYDMKHHPMDDTLRPKAAAKRSVRFKGLPASPTPSPSTPKTTKKSKTVNRKSESSPTPTYDDPFTKPLSGDWSQLNDFDGRIYQLQRGAPLESDVLPLKWSKVVKTLIGEELLSKEQLGACGGHAALKARYEEVRIAVRESFGVAAEDEPMNNDQLEWMQVEDVRVFDLRGGEKYWKHKRDSIVTREIEDVNDLEAAEHSEGYRTTREELDEDSAVQSPTAAAKSEVLSDRASEVTTEDPVMLPDPEASLMASLRNDISASIESFMSQDEVEELISQQESRKKDGVIAGLSNDNPDDKEDDTDEPASSQSDDLQFSPTVPPGVQRAARRLQHTKRTQEKEKKRLIEEEKKKQEQQNLLKKPESVIASRYELAGVVVSNKKSVSAAITPPLPKPEAVNKKRTQPGTMFKVHEDQPGQTLIIKKHIAAYPKSPGTDLPKENIDEETRNNDALSSPVADSHHRLQRAMMHEFSISDMSSPMVATNAPARLYQSLFGSPNTPALLPPFAPLVDPVSPAARTVARPQRLPSLGTSNPPAGRSYSHNTTTPTLPVSSYPTNPTVTVFPSAHRRRPRPVAGDFMSD